MVSRGSLLEKDLIKLSITCNKHGIHFFLIILIYDIIEWCNCTNKIWSAIHIKCIGSIQSTLRIVGWHLKKWSTGNQCYLSRGLAVIIKNQHLMKWITSQSGKVFRQAQRQRTILGKGRYIVLKLKTQQKAIHADGFFINIKSIIWRRLSSRRYHSFSCILQELMATYFLLLH